jgi:adenylosuccinate lyase
MLLTHGQTASPTTLGKEYANCALPRTHAARPWKFPAVEWRGG